MADKPKTRYQELQAAIKQSGLHMAERELFRALLDLADYQTGYIPEIFQPRSLDDLARKAGMSLATVKRVLTELEGRQWVERDRPVNPGRGHRTIYQLRVGIGRT